jgi:hypothetical protein
MEEEQIEEPSMEKLQKAIKKMKNNNHQGLKIYWLNLPNLVDMICINIYMSYLSKYGRRKHCLRNGRRAFYAQHTRKEILWTVKTAEVYLF